MVNKLLMFNEEPKQFGPQHLIYIFVAFALSLFLWIYLGKKIKSKESQDKIIKITGVLLLMMLFLNRLFLVVYLKRPFFPQSWCSAIALFFGLSTLVFKRNNPIFHYLAPIGFLSGLLPTLLPDYLNEGYLICGCTSILFPTTIFALLYHSTLLFISVLIYVFKFIKPDIKKWYYFIFGYGFCMIYGLIYMNLMDPDFVDVLGKSLNFMNINKPIFAFFDAKWIGALGFAAYLIYLYIFEFIKKKKQL